MYPGPGNGLAALPSGGLEPMRLMLDACVTTESNPESREETYAKICKRCPFFASWSRHEARSLLLR
jgi:hypothetical protein